MKRAFEINFFETGSSFELVETRFTSFDALVHKCVRGKTAGALRGAGSFQWTSAVKGIAVLSLRHRLSETIPTIDKHITGLQGSLASSLDYALSKAPCWISDMFGVFQNGRLVARRLFLVTNPNQKRPGPVTVAINDSTLPASDIQIFVNGHCVTEPEALLNILKNLEADISQELFASTSGFIKLAS